MELFVLILIAGVAGYLLAGSRYSKTIDDATEKAAAETRKAADSAGSWFTRTFRSPRKPKDEVVEAEAQPAAPAAEEPPAAARQASRRYSDEPADEPPVS